jgi:peptide subunit release factor 1 (eRF1)
MATDLLATLQQLTTRSSTAFPLLSIYLDWTTDSSGKRPALRLLADELDRIAAEVAGEPDKRESFNLDRERIMAYVDREVPSEARGVAIFACAGEDLWTPLPLQIAVETRVVADRYPHVFELARICDDYETYALVLADGQDAQIFVIALRETELAAETDAGEKIKRFDEGGQAQMLFQRRTENVIKAHTKELAAELDKVIDRFGVRHVIVSTNDSVKSHVMGSLSEKARGMLVETLNLDKSSVGPAQILAALDPLMAEQERKQEAAAVALLEEQNYDGGLGVAGVNATAQALVKGQVHTLLIAQSFGLAGGECPNCGLLRAGQRQKCPLDGFEMQPVELREAFTARAIQQSADVQVITQSDYLDQHEGVGAILRYLETEQGSGWKTASEG